MTTIEQYRGMLTVNKHRLDDELEIQADIMGRISDQVVIANSRAIEAKDQLAAVEARLQIELKESDPKITVAMMEAESKTHRKRVAAWQALQAARAEHESWAGLLEAWKERGRAMKLLGDLYGAQYWTHTSIGVQERTQRSMDETTDALRAQMRRSGHQDRAVQVAEPSRRRRVVE